MEFIKWILRSRKAKLVLTTVAGILSSALAGAISPMDAIWAIVPLVFGWILSIAWEDSARRRQIFVSADYLLEKAGELLTAAEEAAGKIEREEPAG